MEREEESVREERRERERETRRKGCVKWDKCVCVCVCVFPREGVTQGQSECAPDNVYSEQ